MRVRFLIAAALLPAGEPDSPPAYAETFVPTAPICGQP